MGNFKYVKFDESSTSISDFQFLFRQSFQKDISAEYVRRLFNQENAQHSYFAYDEDNQPVGFLGIVIARFRTPNGIVIGGQIASALTHKSIRGKGHFKALAAHIHDQARKHGVDFFYGFPNAASYPLWVKLGWKFYGSMQRYRIWVATLPISTLAARIKPLQGVYAWYTNLIIARYRIQSQEFTSVAANKDAVVSVRDHDFLKTKDSSASHFIKIDGIRYWIKVTGSLWIGDVDSGANNICWQHIKKLKSLARLLGTPKIEIQVSPDCKLDLILSEELNRFAGAPIGFAEFNHNVDYQNIKFSYVDFDSFGV